MHPNLELFVIFAIGAASGAFAYQQYLEATAPSELSEIGRKAVEGVDEVLGIETFDLIQPTLVLQALRQDEMSCAFCFLESSLDQDIRQLESLVEEASESAREFSAIQLGYAREYTSQYPYDEAACESACKRFAGVE